MADCWLGRSDGVMASPRDPGLRPSPSLHWLPVLLALLCTPATGKCPWLFKGALNTKIIKNQLFLNLRKLREY